MLPASLVAALIHACTLACTLARTLACTLAVDLGANPLRPEPAWPGALAADARAALALPEAQRLRAIERLGARGGPAASPFLIPLLRDADPGLRLYAARRLSRSGDPAAITAAVAWILTPTIAQVDRPFALEILGDGASFPVAAREVVERALRDPDPGIRSQALDVLERHDAALSLPAVLAALDDDNREVRLRAVRLAAAGGPDARAALPLLARLEDGDHQVRIEAIRALGAHPRAGAALLRLAAEGSDDARVAAVDALGGLPAAGPEPMLAGLARRRPADDLARHAQIALGRLATPAAIGALIAVARTPPVSDETRGAIRRVGPAGVLALIHELEGGTATSVAFAAAALGDIGDRRATAALAAAVDRRPDAEPVLIDALARLADPGALPALARAAESPVRETRLAAFEALLAIGDGRGSAAVERGLADPDPAVRARAARLAAATAASGSTPALAALVAGEREPAVRGAAAAALARVGAVSHASWSAILSGLAGPRAPLRDDDEWRDVGDALARLAEPADLARLGPAFVSAHGPERLALARALAAAAAARPVTPPLDSALTAALVAALAGGGRQALAAADVLAAAPLPAGARVAFSAAFAASEPEVRARLCPAVARLEGGGAWLGALVAAAAEPAEVRAAAAWAGRGLAAAAPALTAAALMGDGPVAANARAARTVGGNRSPATELRLRAADGSAEVGRWVSLSAPGGVVVWAMTDAAGAARLEGLPDGPLALGAPAALLRPDGP